jgi:hypothetical protein
MLGHTYRVTLPLLELELPWQELTSLTWLERLVLRRTPTGLPFNPRSAKCRATSTLQLMILLRNALITFGSHRSVTLPSQEGEGQENDQHQPLQSFILLEPVSLRNSSEWEQFAFLGGCSWHKLSLSMWPREIPTDVAERSRVLSGGQKEALSVSWAEGRH